MLNSSAWRPAARGLLQNQRTLLAVYVIVAIAASIQSVIIGTHACGDFVYTDYNNYIIFRQSFFHLVDGKNLYASFPSEQWDRFKYSPAFALAMSAFAYLPDVVGLCTWNLLNVIVFFSAVRLLPMKKEKMSLLFWFVLVEMLTSVQNAQSNGLVAGLMIAAFACMERRRVGVATLCIVIATFIKVYGGIGLCLVLFYPGKIKFAGYTIVWTLIFALLPLGVLPVQTLVWQYGNWGDVLLEDQSIRCGLSVMGWLHTWFGITIGKGIVSVAGIVLFLLPFGRRSLYNDPLFRMRILASMLIWVVIFSHMAESPTYIIAVAGVGVWYFARSAGASGVFMKKGQMMAMALVFIFTCLSPTDLFSPYLIDHFFVPYAIKAVPCILVWCITWFELMTMRKQSHPGQTSAFIVG